MALDVPGTCIGAATDAASIPIMAIQNQWHTINQDYYYSNNLPAPPRYQINRGSYRDQQQSWEMLQMLRGNRTLDYDGNIVPRNALRGPGRCGGGNVRANNVDPPYDGAASEGDLGGCAIAPRSGAGWLLLVGLGALVVRRRRRR
jgi:MYXO-CTERM domain-containing protein